MRWKARVLALVTSGAGKVWFVVANTGVGNFAVLSRLWMQCTEDWKSLSAVSFNLVDANVLRRRTDAI